MRSPLPRFAAVSVIVLAVVAAVGCSSDGPTEPPGTGGPVGYVAMGASDALGVGADPLSEGYVFEIRDRIRAARGSVDLDNLGIPGAEIDDFLDFELPRALAADPDVITLWVGSNDVISGLAADAFGAQLDTLLRELARGTSARVFIGDLVDLTRVPRFRTDPDPDVTAARVAAFNDQIRARAAAHGAVLVRLSDVPLDDAFFSADGFHPSNSCHDRIAEEFWRELAPRL